jgi:peptidoglycan hydrolase-like protein with peptidoglycan-binding domain
VDVEKELAVSPVVALPDAIPNRYDKKLRKKFAQFSTGTLPDLDLRAAQLYLTFAGFSPGPVDGLAGPRTDAALREYQAHHGLPVTGTVDQAVLDSLAAVALA